MLNYFLILCFSVVYFHNSDVNRLPLFVILSRGMPCNRMTSFRKSVVKCHVLRSFLHGMKGQIFVSRSMVTSIVSYPSEFGKSVMKSITIDFHGWSGIMFDWNTL